MNRKTIIAICKYGASVGILWWLYSKHKNEFDDFLTVEKNYRWLALAAFTITLAFMTSYVRWFVLAKAIRLNLNLSEATKLGFIGSFFNVVAFGVVGGDSLRAFYVARNERERIPEAILSVFFDRFVGLCVMFGFAGMAWLIVGIPVDVPETRAQQGIRITCQFALLCSAIGFSCIGAFVFVPGIKNLKLVRWLCALPKIGYLLERAIDAATMYNVNKLAVGKAIGLSLVTNILFAITIYLVAQAITDDPPQLSNHFVMAPIAMVANSAPLPGGVGGMEAALPALYKGFNAQGGFIVALGYRLCILIVSLIGLIVWLAYRNRIDTSTVDA